MEVLLYADVPFIVRNDGLPSLLAVYLPGLKKHVRGRFTHADLGAAITQLRSLRMLITAKTSGDVLTVVVNPPLGFKHDEADPIGRVRLSEEAFGRVPYMTASRLMKETLIEKTIMEMK